MKLIYGRPFTAYLAPLLLWAVALAYVGAALGYGPEARLLPLLVGFALLIMLPIDLISISRSSLGRKLSHSVNPAAAEEPEDLGGTRVQLKALGAMLAFAIALPVLGIALSIPLYVAGSMRLLGRKSWLQSCLTAAVVGIATYALFELALGIALYPGVLFAPRY